ncbi:MAG: hypothetical protein R3B49_07400 [Phycisphaerales bacterium]
MTRTATWALAIAAGAALSAPALAQPRRDGPPGHRDAESMRAQLAGLQPAGADANNANNNTANADSGTAQAPLPLQGTEMISFSSFTEPIELTTLIDFVAEELGINVAIIDQPTGSIVFNAPMSFERERLLPLLDAMLEQYGYTITYDGLTQIYAVRTAAQVRPRFVGDLATTKIIRTPNVTPSLLQNAIIAAMGATPPAPSPTSTSSASSSSPPPHATSNASKRSSARSSPTAISSSSTASSSSTSPPPPPRSGPSSSSAARPPRTAPASSTAPSSDATPTTPTPSRPG